MSGRTQSTENSSKMSRIFPNLDAQLMSTPVYQRAVRSLFKRSISRHKEAGDDSSTNSSLITDRSERKEQTLKSKSIDSVLKRDQTRMASLIRVALLGQSNDASYTLWDQVWECSVEGSQYLLQCRPQILSMIVEIINKLLANCDIILTEAQRSYVSTIAGEPRIRDHMSPELTSTAIKSLSRSFSDCLDRALLESHIAPFPI